MRNFSLLFSLIFVALLLPTVRASTTNDIPVYQQWTDVEIRQVVAVNGSIDTTSANITVYDPSNVVIVSFGVMTKNLTAGDFNYTVPSGKNGKIGIYPYTVCGYSTVAEGKCQDFQYEITPNGQKGLLGFYILVIALTYGLVFLGIYRGDVTITMLGTFGLFFLGIWMLQFGIDTFKNFFTDGLAVTTLGIAFYVSAKVAHEYIQI